MSSPLASALDASTQTFPILTSAQINRIRPLGRLRSVQRGEILFEPNDTAVPFFVLLSGGMDIVQLSADGERLIVAHKPGEFTGEITMISGQRCLVRGRVTEPGDFIELRNALRTLVAKDAELSEILLRAFILRRLELISRGYGNVIVMGSRHSAQTLQLREFLSRNGHPYTFVDLDSDSTSQELLDRFAVKPSEVPVVICNGRDVLRSPSIQKLASCLGFNSSVDGAQVRDLVIIGAGPAGLAAAVYAASEGLDVVMIETSAPGGQAGSSSRIENYLGFPTGVSGQELAARATTQAQKFGASMMIARTIVKLDCGRQTVSGRPRRWRLDPGARGRDRDRSAIQ
jgi:thioredoxin reductase (NADPH)